jgi:hypothetical protein
VKILSKKARVHHSKAAAPRSRPTKPAASTFAAAPLLADCVADGLARVGETFDVSLPPKGAAVGIWKSDETVRPFCAAQA